MIPQVLPPPRSSLLSSSFLSPTHAVFIVYTPPLEYKLHQKIFIYFIHYTQKNAWHIVGI